MKTTVKSISAGCLMITIAVVLCQCKSPVVPTATDATIATDTLSVDSLKSVVVPKADTVKIRTPLTLIIKNLVSKKSPVYVTLYDSTNKFPSKTDHIREYKFTSDGDVLTEQINDLDYGNFAVATYQDLNNDGKCNRNLIGLPKEPYGFSNNFKPTVRAPHFEECTFVYNESAHTVTIAMIR
jgi:uncharacterized protein (DUF2141 family)